MSKLAVKVPASRRAEDPIGPLVALPPYWAAIAPDAGYSPSIDPATFATFVPPAIGTVTRLL